MPASSFALAAILTGFMAQQPVKPVPVVAGYLPEYRFTGQTTAQLRGLTDLILFSVEPTEEGEIGFRDMDLRELARFRRGREADGYRILIPVGGWGRSEHFAKVASSRTLRIKFINELVFFVEKEGLDGIDFDWEHPKDLRESAHYARLVSETKTMLAPRKKIVTAAVASWQELPKSFWASLDRIHLMSYDHPGAHSTLDDSEIDLRNLLRKGAPANKIALGVPFYGRSLTDRKAMSFAEIVKTFNPRPNADEAGDYAYNGPDTIRRKTEFAKREGLAGIMIWEVAQDAPAPNSLLQVIVNELKKP